MIEIESPSEGSPNDAGEISSSWSTLAKGYFSITAKSASEAWRDSQAAEAVDYVLEGLYLAEVIAAGGQCRLQIDTGETWQVVGAFDPNGRQRDMVIFARKGTA